MKHDNIPSGIDFNKLRDRAHQHSLEHGFYDGKPSNEHFLCLIVSEMMEAVEADRKGRHANRPGFELEISLPASPHEAATKEEIYDFWFQGHIKDTVEDELADVVIRCLDLAGANQINFDGIFMSLGMGLVNNGYNRPITELMWGLIGILADPTNDLAHKLQAAIIVMMGYAYNAETDLLWHIERKMEYNSHRPHKHGKKY